MSTKFNRNSHELYKLTPEREQALWGNAVFVFDSSALLDLYYLSLKERSSVFENIIQKLDKRLWGPRHVEYELLINRDKVLNKVFKEKYDPANTKVKSIRDSFAKNVNLILKA